MFRLLQTLGLPVAYMKHVTAQKLPYLVYLGSGSSNFVADNRVYNSENNYTVEYYFDRKSTTTEKKIEKLFNDNEIVWQKSEDIYIRDEEMYLIRYYV
ncbi:hypothetical protein [Microaceticoccus formicicus]|uniref:hypothetical protein n=1 Tax=Microaceticoccus formicicus TaxID=3118105 RepID=UPI003CD00686|nr:hypothetical protein VZL98_01680 [Peptoniphilaceae bacterium AMB_02]